MPTDKYEYVPELLYVWLFQLKDVQELIEELEDVSLKDPGYTQMIKLIWTNNSLKQLPESSEGFRMSGG